jgi:GNAT superfamily N-acetyltransferase
MMVRDATPADNEALVRLAAQCPMAGDVSLCIDRRPDFFALSRLAGDPWRVGVIDGDDGPVACVGVARRRVYVDGRPADVAYVGDLKVHPAHRRRGLARALAGWAGATAGDLTGPGGLALGTVLAGNAAAERLLRQLAPDACRTATVRSYSIQLLWRRRPPRGGLDVRLATLDDEPSMRALWQRLAAARRFAPVCDSFPLRTVDYLVAHRQDGRLAGFLGLWDQHGIKQLRVTGYSPRLAIARTAFNAVAPLTRAPRLPPPGGQLRYRTVVNPCAPDPATLRALLHHAHDRLRGDYSFVTIGLDTRDPLTAALRGMLAQPTDVALVVRGGPGVPDRPVHFEIATV